METLIDILIKYESLQYINLILTIIGTLYISLVLLRGFLTAFVKATKTNKDDKIINSIYDFCDKYSLSFKKTEKYSKLKK